MIMEHTGERMIPEISDASIFWEHIYRYRFAIPFIQKKDVLDVACGEGYGSAGLKAGGAGSVIGVDIDPETCRHALEKYQSYGIEIRQGNSSSLPLADQTVDVVVSFETIEHVENPNQFLRECFRVLRNGGTAIISTPNVDVFNPGRDPAHNIYHCSEMTLTEFRMELAKVFNRFRIYSQQPRAARWWHPRSLAVRKWGQSPWTGFRVMSNISWHSPVYNTDFIKTAREDPVAAICNPEENFLQSLGNTYRIRSMSPLSGEQPTYFVAVAKKDN